MLPPYGVGFFLRSASKQDTKWVMGDAGAGGTWGRTPRRRIISVPMAQGKRVGLILGLARCCGQLGCVSQGQLAGDVASVQRSSAPSCGPSKPLRREVGPIC